MRTKYILAILMAAATITGCTEKKVVEGTYQNGNPRIVKYYHNKGKEKVLDREIIFYENSTKKMEGAYKNDQRDGMWRAWYENGTLWSEGAYKDGKRNGMGIAYHPNGKKHIEGMYRDDMRVGKWIFYDTTGAVVQEVDFDQVRQKMEGDSVK